MAAAAFACGSDPSEPSPNRQADLRSVSLQLLVDGSAFPLATAELDSDGLLAIEPSRANVEIESETAFRFGEDCLVLRASGEGAAVAGRRFEAGTKFEARVEPELQVSGSMGSFGDYEAEGVLQLGRVLEDVALGVFGDGGSVLSASGSTVTFECRLTREPSTWAVRILRSASLEDETFEAVDDKVFEFVSVSSAVTVARVLEPNATGDVRFQAGAGAIDIAQGDCALDGPELVLERPEGREGVCRIFVRGEERTYSRTGDETFDFVLRPGVRTNESRCTAFGPCQDVVGEEYEVIHFLPFEEVSVAFGEGVVAIDPFDSLDCGYSSKPHELSLQFLLSPGTSPEVWEASCIPEPLESERIAPLRLEVLGEGKVEVSYWPQSSSEFAFDFAPCPSFESGLCLRRIPDPVLLRAVPASGFEFVRWEDSSSELAPNETVAAPCQASNVPNIGANGNIVGEEGGLPPSTYAVSCRAVFARVP